MSEQPKIDNPYQFILVAGARTNQLLKGAQPRVKLKARKPTFVALEELKQGKLEVEIQETAPESTDLLSLDI